LQHGIGECFVTPDAQGRGLGFFALMGGSVLGAALQLQQAALWGAEIYAAMLAAASACLLLLRGRRPSARILLPAMLIAGTMAGAGLAGWRACAYAAEALDPALEGRDLQVVGVVAQMPQRGDGAVRFLLDVESARWAGDAERSLPRVPSRIALGWYADNTGLWGRAPEEAARAAPAAAAAPVHAGERWQMTVRLKAPHGNLNPHGFDQELRLWEQDVHASGYVRTGARDAQPQRQAQTWRHPVERAREAVRDAVFERVAERRAAGVIAPWSPATRTRSSVPTGTCSAPQAWRT